MKSLKLTGLLLAVCLVMCARDEGSSPKPAPATQPQEGASSKESRSNVDNCEAQLGTVCVITLGQLRDMEARHNREHAPIKVKQGHIVVWIADREENFRFDRFKLVNCKNEEGLTDQDDRGPFDKDYRRDKYEKVKYATVNGKVGNCYKHVIDVNNGKEKIDPHIMIEAGP